MLVNHHIAHALLGDIGECLGHFWGVNTGQANPLLLLGCVKDCDRIENVIRPVALGRKNWLFTGSEQAGKRAAAIQTLLGTAKLNGLDPGVWLRNTMARLPNCFNSQIDSLLPLRAEPLLQTIS